MWNVFIVDDQTPKGRVDICLIDKVENLDIARKLSKKITVSNLLKCQSMMRRTLKCILILPKINVLQCM